MRRRRQLRARIMITLVMVTAGTVLGMYASDPIGWAAVALLVLSATTAIVIDDVMAAEEERAHEYEHW